MSVAAKLGLHTGNNGGNTFEVFLLNGFFLNYCLIGFLWYVPPYFCRINEEWKSRWSAKDAKGRRLEKRSKPAVPQMEENIWKSKPSQAPSNLLGAGQPGRPGVQRVGVSFSTSAPNNNAKKGFAILRRQQLLDLLSKTQPSSVMWDKAWKSNKPLPPPEEGAPAVSDWGKCWMFATRQPYSEDGKTWLNGPNTMDPQSLRLCKKSDYAFVRSQWQNVDLQTETWDMSWKKYFKSNHKGAMSAHEDHNAKSGLLDEAQHSDVMEEWINSWRSIKPGKQVPHGVHTNDSAENKQDKGGVTSSDLECWRLINHLGGSRSNSRQVQRSCDPEWADSWRAATSNHENSAATLSQDRTESPGDHYQRQIDPSQHNVLLMADKLRRQDKHLVTGEESKPMTEWDKSWQVAKNNSKPCAEIEKVLKASLLKREANSQKVENGGAKFSAAEGRDVMHSNQHAHAEIHQPKRELARLYQKQTSNVLSATEWRESWRTLKNRIRMERGRVRSDPLRSLGSVDREQQKNWADAWKCTPLPLRQEPQMWQQQWPTVNRVRVDRARVLNHFAPIELPRNGPTGERIYGESWRSFSPQCRPAPTQGGIPSEHVSHPEDPANRRSVQCRGFAGAVANWEGAWMVPNAQSHCERPSWTLWGEAWRWSLLNAPNRMWQVSHANEVEEVMEIRACRETVPQQAAATTMSRSLHLNVFRERCPEEQWRPSWRVASLLSHQQSLCGTPTTPVTGATQRQHVADDRQESKWGLPFRLANPMPHMEQPWVESSSNMCHYTVMWERKINTQSKLMVSCSSNHMVARLWANSHHFLLGITAKGAQRSGGKESVDPVVIVRKKTKSKNYLFSKMEKQSERKWAGCHLLGKTQPRPKRGPGAVKKLDKEDDNKFQEEWAESWRYLVVKMKPPTKSLSGWVESWKFLLPLYQPMNGPRAK